MNKTYKKLYKRDSTGKIRVWWAQQFNDEYCFFSGINEGKIVQSKNTIVKPKNVGKTNETTSCEQARLEIEAKYTKQQKLGYTDDINKIDSAAKKFIKPMLAKNYKDYASKIDLSSGNYILQCKLNGHRCIATKDGLFTRKGEEYLSVPHISEALKPFFDKFTDAVLDGELFNEDLRQQLNELSKLIRKTKHITEEDLKNSAELVRYYVYDGYGMTCDGATLDKKSKYEIRKKSIDRFIDGFNVDCITYVANYPVKSEEGFFKIYNQFIEDGHEGAMLRDLNSEYENKRSKYLLKIKPDDDSEAMIIDIIEGKGNWSGTAKTATLKWGDKEFDATFKGTQEQLSEILKNKQKWLDKEVTFLYNGLTGLHTPNFARIDVNNCFKK